jgi:hypothetical protein
MHPWFAAMAWKRSDAYPRRAPNAHRHRPDATPCTDQQGRSSSSTRVSGVRNETHLGPIWAQRLRYESTHPFVADIRQVFGHAHELL